jgi:hypothetical protein
LKNGEHSRHIFHNLFFYQKKDGGVRFSDFSFKKKKNWRRKWIGRPTSGFTACRESSQPSGSQTVAAEVFDLTLVEPEKEKNEALVVWKKLELKLRIKSEKK